MMGDFVHCLTPEELCVVCVKVVRGSDILRVALAIVMAGVLLVEISDCAAEGHQRRASSLIRGMGYAWEVWVHQTARGGEENESPPRLRNTKVGRALFRHTDGIFQLDESHLHLAQMGTVLREEQAKNYK
jgi:excinuclease UvrABC helicase subunit UvrB